MFLALLPAFRAGGSGGSSLYADQQLHRNDPDDRLIIRADLGVSSAGQAGAHLQGLVLEPKSFPPGLAQFF